MAHASVSPLDNGQVTGGNELPASIPTPPPPNMGPSPPGLEKENIELFGFRMGQTVNSGFLLLSIAMGRETGLFDALANFTEPKTSKEIAEATGLKERYIREWLGAMVTGQIVESNETSTRFLLPPHRAAFLRTGGFGEEMTLLAAALPMQCSVFDKVLNCFKEDGPRGVPYKHYCGFQKFMNACSSAWWNRHLISDFIPSMPEVQEMLEKGIDVLDLGCGSGGASILLAERFPKSTFIAIDISDDAINTAKSTVTEKKLTNVTFLKMDALEMPEEKWQGKFGYVLAWDSIHDMAQPEVVLNLLHKCLSNNGRMTVMEVNAHSEIAQNVNMPFASTFYTNSLMHCMTVSLAFEDGQGFGNMYGRQKLMALLQLTGFNDIQTSVPNMSFNCHFLCSK
ncbi:S-adenosylmethionine-dependent methyltransferase Rv2258c-like [Antedon mediterranea]|uniref:S-adenosylmethionine-dependent methyltransferase Rv2258c-like n=1 Tax=Antedon mediterranea TaxID=105859 RepID=UPI003AF9C7D9